MSEPAGVEKVNKVRVLALCGGSVLIEGIKASLQDREGVEIVLLDSTHPSHEVLNRLCPDIIIFDLIPDQLRSIFTFLQTHTDVVLIGLDITSDQALFLSAEWRVLPTIADLMQVIDTRIQAKNGKQL